MDDKAELTARQRHLREIDIPHWERGGCTWFTIRLFDLFAHADEGNKTRLAFGFPEEHEAFMWWFNGKDGG